MKFINRTTEMEFLNREYNSEESSLVIIYGRRRIGKTALITQFCKDKNALYFLATEESETENRNNFKELVSEYTGNELLGSAIIKKWDVILKSIIDYKTSEKKVIIIDEFQYLGKGNPAFPSVFQKAWDTVLKDANIMVILCGTLITMMESQTLSYNSPLYGRRTGQIKLQQISFEHYREFYPNMKKKELIEYYSVTGGVPK
jgi:AAA+ ATPase superfamily predicted ATPase